MPPTEYNMMNLVVVVNIDRICVSQRPTVQSSDMCIKISNYHQNQTLFGNLLKIMNNVSLY